MTSQEVALQVIQQAICILAGWAEATLPDGCQQGDRKGVFPIQCHNRRES